MPIEPRGFRYVRRLWVCALAVALVPAVAAGAVKTYTSAPAAFIADGNPGPTVTDTIAVPDTGTVDDVNVVVTLHHPELADVSFHLVGPDGTRIQVFDRDLGVGDAIVDVTFDDEAGALPTGFTVNGTCQVGNSFQSKIALSAFDGKALNGDWTLEVTDNAAGDAVDCDCDGFVVGPACPRRLDEWKLVIEYTPSGPAPGPVDSDGDGIANRDDNCPKAPNLDQEDKDRDGRGCVCDRDEDCCPTSLARLCPCPGPAGYRKPWPSHDDYVACVKDKLKTFIEWGVIDEKRAKGLLDRASRSHCGSRSLS